MYTHVHNHMPRLRLLSKVWLEGLFEFAFLAVMTIDFTHKFDINLFRKVWRKYLYNLLSILPNNLINIYRETQKNHLLFKNSNFQTLYIHTAATGRHISCMQIKIEAFASQWYQTCDWLIFLAGHEMPTTTLLEISSNKICHKSSLIELHCRHPDVAWLGLTNQSD